MTITREQIGRALGFLVFALLVFGIAYAIMAFVTWQFDPGYWSPAARCSSVVVMGMLILVRGIIANVRVVSDNA
jgi:hypothetical protein